MFYFQSVNTSDSTSFKQRRYGEAERAEQKQEKVEKLARSTLALKHNEAQRSSLYHIDNNHLTSAKSPRAPPRSGAQCTQYIFILQVAISCIKVDIDNLFRFAGEKWPSKKTSDPGIGSGSNALAPAAKNWGRSQGGGGGGRFLRPSQVWCWEQAKAKFGESSISSSVWLSMVWRIQVKTFSEWRKIWRNQVSRVYLVWG